MHYYTLLWMILKLILSYTEVEFFTIVQELVCLLFILIYQTIKSSKVEYTTDYYRVSKVILLLKQNQQIAIAQNVMK
jgi:hypothetical protein